MPIRAYHVGTVVLHDPSPAKGLMSPKISNRRSVSRR
jgi:hypothetical protein